MGEGTSGAQRRAGAGGQADPPRAPWAADVATHRRIRGRRWRVSDPRIPEHLRRRLVDELMAARRAVRDAAGPAEERAARDRVQDAKVALGERGLRWWSAAPDPDGQRDRTLRARRALARTGEAPPDQVAEVVSAPVAQVAATLRGDQPEEPGQG